MNTTSQYIVLPLQIGVVYSFRVRGADSIDRLGEWSDYFIFPSKYFMCQLYLLMCYDNIVIGPPPAPSNLTVTILNKEDSTLSVNLTWSQENSRYVVVYYVEVTAATYTMSITNTTSQYIVLPLQIGVVYSFRVRGTDSINRLGEWSDSYQFPSKPLYIVKSIHIKICMHASNCSCKIC